MNIIAFILINIFSENENNLIFITGQAGTGKTYLLQILRKILEHLWNLNLKKLLSTGITATSFQGETARSFFLMSINII